MSNNPPTTLQRLAGNSSAARRSEDPPHLSWFETHQAARSLQDARSMPPPSARPHHLESASQPPVPAEPQLRYRPESPEPYNPYAEFGGLEEYLLQQSHNRTTSVDPVDPLDPFARSLDPNRVRFIPPDPPNGGIDPALETDAQRERREMIEESTRRIQDMLRTTELARAMMPPRPPYFPFPRPGDESSDENRDRQHANSTLGYLDRQRAFRERFAIVEQLRNGTITDSVTATSIDVTTGRPTPIASNETPNDATGAIERSNNARRSLDNAVRNYRLTRSAADRARDSNESGTPGEQNSPSYQGLLAQLAEQSNNRNRMRARGQSRANALEQTDAPVETIINAASVSDDMWRRIDDRDTVTEPAAAISTQASGGTDAPGSANPILAHLEDGPPPIVGNLANINNSTRNSLADIHRRIANQQRALAAERLANQRASASAYSAVTAVGPGNGPAIEGRGDQTLHQSVDRLNRSLGQLHSKSNKSSHTAKSRARKMIQYLTELRKCHDNPGRSLALTKAMGIESLAASLTKGTELDLPLRIDQMPHPRYSSWLEAGMSWEGVQKGGFGKPDSDPNPSTSGFGTGPLFDRGTSLEDRVVSLRAWRHRERVRSERQTRLSQPESNTGDETRGLLGGVAESEDTLADVERHLTDLLEEEERRAGRNGNSEWRTTQTAPASAEEDELEDKWPVNVTLHEVNWETMTVSGTMVASQVPDVPLSLVTPGNGSDEGAAHDKDYKGGSSSSVMETFFDGEIIDFRNHELETVGHKAGYNVGGAVTDLKYWSRIGPFKREVAKQIQLAKEKKASEVYEKRDTTSTLNGPKAEDHSVVEELDMDDVRAVAYNAMATCLGSQKWMKEAMGEGGWVFMRWKERCFIDPSSKTPCSSSAPAQTTTEPSHARTRTIITRGNSFAAIANRNNRNQSFTTSYTDEGHHSHHAWGLTIRGFYYVALNRLSGKIEALYYDSGSQPYQELKCVPAGMSQKKKGTDSGEDDLDLGVDIGVKKDFGVFEFR